MSTLNPSGGGPKIAVPGNPAPTPPPLTANSAEWLQTTLACIGDGVITTDPSGRVTFLNRVAEALTGWTHEQGTADGGQPIERVFNIINESTRTSVASPTSRALREGVIVGLANHTILIAKNGTEVPIADSAAPIRNVLGKTAGAVLVFRDVTEHKRQERLVRGARDFAENILDTQREPFLVLDKNLRVVSANRAFYFTFRVEMDATTGRFVYDLGDGQWNIPKLRELLEDVLPRDHAFEGFQVAHNFPGGLGQKTMLINARRVSKQGDDSELILLAIEDITERVRSRLLLAAQQEILELAASGGTLDNVFNLLVRSAQQHSGVDSRVTMFTLAQGADRLRFVAGAGMAESYTTAVEQFVIGPHSPPSSLAAFSGETVVVSDVTKDPRWAPFLHLASDHDIRACWSEPIRTIDGRIMGTIAIYHRVPGGPGPGDLDAVKLLSQTAALVIGRQKDLEQRKQAEEELRESEGRYRTLFNSIDEGFCVIEVMFDEHQRPVDYRFLEVNSTFEKQCGLNDVIGKTMRELRPEHEESWFQIYGKVALTGEPIRLISEAKELAGRWYDLYACRVGGAHSRNVAVMFNDITESKQSQEALRDSHARFEKLFDTSPVGMYLVDQQFRLRKMSAKTRTVFGDITDLFDRDFAEVLHILWPPAVADEIVARFRHTLATGEVYKHAELSEVRYDLHVREYYEWELHRIAMPDGQYGVVCYFLDISARVLAQQALRDSEIRYRRLFETAKDGILILDAHTGKITDANAFMGVLTGMPSDELLGKQLFEIGMYADVEENKAAFRELQRTKYLRHDHLPVHNRRGEKVEVEFVANVYHEGDALVAQCNVRDISDRVRLERTLATQADALTAQARAKDEFLAMLSHELRNPLAPIRAAAHLLRLQERTAGALINPVQQQAREIIERQVASLTRMVSDLSEVSRVISGRIRLDMQPVDLKQVVKHALQTVAPIIEQRRHSVSVTLCAEPVWVQADPTRLEEVLVNLLHNAAKYTPDGGRISVECEYHREAARQRGIVRVRDNGVGIEEALLPRVFDLFTQADRSLDRSSGGLGIGLSLAQRLMALHSGTVTAASQGPGQGSTFTLTLPLIASAADTATIPTMPTIVALNDTADARPDSSADPATAAIRVLVVDDNVDLVTMLCGTLRHKGYVVQTAYNGPDGLRIAQQWKPEIALLDIGLPGLDGYAIARRIRAEAAAPTGTAPRIKLIAITGYGRDDDIALARDAGFDAHMVKPCDIELLEQMMADPALSM